MKSPMKKCTAILLILLLLTAILPPAFATPWTEDDVPSEWAEWYVREAHKRNLVPETLLSRFWEPITRVEFTHLAVYLYETVTGEEITGRVTFTDTDDVNAQKMAYLGVVQGMGSGRFDPDGLLDREQAATMLSRLVDALDVPTGEHDATFYDNDLISDWAIEHVGTMQYTGIMGGVGNNRFDPHGRYTIEQSITTMLRVYDIVFASNVPEYITIRGVQIPTTATSLYSDGRWGGGGASMDGERIEWGGGPLTNQDIEPLRYMVNLTILHINDNNITDISPIARLTNLRNLNIGNNQFSYDVWAQRQWNNNITDLTPLTGLRNLETLNTMQLPNADITPLAGFTNLRELHMWNNQISDLTPISGLTNLTSLTLNMNSISDLTPLSGMTHLRTLTLPHNNITDITPLAGLTSLTFLRLEGNNVNDITPLAGLTNLREVFLGNNPVTDWSPVDHVQFVHGRPQ